MDITNITNLTSLKGSGKASYTTQYQALYDSLDTTPSDELALVQNTFIKTLVDNSIWDKLVCLMPLSAGMTTQADALRWWNAPVTRTGTLINTPTYIAKEGFKGNAVDAAIDPTFNPTADGDSIFTQNSATIGWHFYNFRRASDSNKGSGYFDYTEYNGIMIIPRGVSFTTTALNSSYRDGAKKLVNNIITLDRSDSSTWKMYLNKTYITDLSRPSKAMINATPKLLAIDNLGVLEKFSDDTIGLYFAGDLTPAEIEILVDAYFILIQNVYSEPILTDDCDNSSIDLTKWTIVNGDTDAVTFDETTTLNMNSLEGTDTAYDNIITANDARNFGVWRFAFTDVGEVGESGNIREIGLMASDLNTSLIGLIRLTDINIGLQIRETGTTKYYLADTGIENFAQIKIVVTPFHEIKVYRWINDSWIQIGVTQTYNLGEMKLYMSSIGTELALTQIGDVDITTYDYNTLRP